jgi:nuclear protein localization protein 4 homolog
MLVEREDELTFKQEEEALLCKVATEHNVADAMQLAHSSGWENLMAILDNYGERPLKRQWVQDNPSDHGSLGEQLAKRFKQASIVP